MSRRGKGRVGGEMGRVEGEGVSRRGLKFIFL